MDKRNEKFLQISFNYRILVPNLTNAFVYWKNQIAFHVPLNVFDWQLVSMVFDRVWFVRSYVVEQYLEKQIEIDDETSSRNEFWYFKTNMSSWGSHSQIERITELERRHGTSSFDAVCVACAIFEEHVERAVERS